MQQQGGRSRKFDGGVTMGDLGLIVVKVPAADNDLRRYDRWSLVGDLPCYLPQSLLVINLTRDWCPFLYAMDGALVYALGRSKASCLPCVDALSTMVPQDVIGCFLCVPLLGRILDC